MTNLQNKQTALSEKSIDLIWKYYCTFSVVNMTVNMERAVTGMAIRRALEDCMSAKDRETYLNIVRGTKGWKTLDDSFAKIRLKKQTK